MNRIDKIKEKVSSWEDEPCLTTEEARYLISRLEIAERVLNKILDDRAKDIPAENVVPVYRELAFQAIQQLRS